MTAISPRYLEPLHLRKCLQLWLYPSLNTCADAWTSVLVFCIIPISVHSHARYVRPIVSGHRRLRPVGRTLQNLHLELRTRNCSCTLFSTKHKEKTHNNVCRIFFDERRIFNRSMNLRILSHLRMQHQPSHELLVDSECLYLISNCCRITCTLRNREIDQLA
jgi:hypothetical protein